MFSVCIFKHLLERGVIVLRPRGTLARGTVAGQGLCEGLDKSLNEVVVLGLITCVGVGLVS